MAFKKYSEIQHVFKVQEECEGGATSLSATPGMGNPTLPSGESYGSGDLFPSIMDYKPKKKRKKKK